MNPANVSAMSALSPSPTASPSISGFSGDISFSDVLKNAVNQVNQVNDSAAAQVNSLVQGGNADMNNVMIAVEKADVSFQLMMQVRNKIVSAYQEIEKMQF
jgi:flagellar hook-basal body complex protein FliE